MRGESSGETAHIHRLVFVLDANQCDKYKKSHVLARILALMQETRSSGL